jgi:shikimate dehydrogenase
MVNKFALIGYPLGHSVSAVIQKEGLKSLNINGSYDILETSPDMLIDRIKYLKTQNYDGFNITIPLKVPMSLFLDGIDNYANLAGCANTVKIEQDKSFSGYNTDVYGFKAPLDEEMQENLRGKTVSILGAGGAARAITVALNDLGVKEIEFYVRNVINAEDMISSLRNSFQNIRFESYAITNIRNLAHTSMLVNATPIGMRGHSMDQIPIKFTDLNTLSEDCIVYDVIYNPQKTILLKEADKIGLKTISGLDMLVNQGAKSLEIWTGQMPDVNAMKIAALENL